MQLSELGLKDITEIQSGTELLYLYELSRYAKEYLGKAIDFQGIKVSEEYKGSMYYEYCQLEKFKLVPTTKVGVGKAELYKMFNPFKEEIKGIKFEEITDEEWVFDYNTDKDANHVLNKVNRSLGYVSLHAYITILNYKNGKKLPKLKIKNTSYYQEDGIYRDILILMNLGNCLLKDKVSITYSKHVSIQPEWDAYIYYHKQKGYMLEPENVNNKWEYFNNTYQVGDVLLLYNIAPPVQTKSIRKLLSCYPAILRDIKGNTLYFEYIPDITTSLTKQRQSEEMQELLEGEIVLNELDVNSFTLCKLTVDMYSLGVDHLFYKEEQYVVRPFVGTDFFTQWLVDSKGIERVYTLNTLDTIYAVLEDREIEYNKGRFLENFNGVKPIYDIIRK